VSISILTPPPSGEAPVAFGELVDRARAALPADLPRDLSRVLVALDVDGTLLRPDGASPRVRAAFRDLVEAGANVVIASGRGMNAVRPVFDYVETDRGWAVCSNGAVTARWDPALKDGAEVVALHRFDPSPAIDALLGAVPDIILGVEDLDGYYVSREFPAGEMVEDCWVMPVPHLRGRLTAKLIGRAPWMDREDFDALVRGLGLDRRFEYSVGWTSWVDIGPRGCTKATGLQDLADQLGVPAAGTVAVGDGTNDVPMLRWAAHGVAMGGASAEVRAHADAVTGAVEHDGAAAVMRAILER
jgi:hydroxymethylpyrimidine pyrophosphatase-like HAD family hydrolase